MTKYVLNIASIHKSNSHINNKTYFKLFNTDENCHQDVSRNVLPHITTKLSKIAQLNKIDR